ncbi:hypothetical protein [Streptomyces sp. NPDC050988]|uniref:hypothetical protein n=1 Tax=Streptomyces sp. NPDC050988 TaxID=3365637 RepID=UPI0037A003A1
MAEADLDALVRAYVPPPEECARQLCACEGKRVTRMQQYAPALGDTVEDTRRRAIGRVMGFVGPYVQLRPVDGGREWDARQEWLRPVSLTEALSAGVAAANARSRGERS